MVFLSTDNCSAACCCQCSRSSLDIGKVEGLGSVAWQQMVREGNSGERNSGAYLEANVHNAAADEVNYTNGYGSMAMFETRSDDAMTLMMDYKVMVVLLFASPACR